MAEYTPDKAEIVRTLSVLLSQGTAVELRRTPPEM